MMLHIRIIIPLHLWKLLCVPDSYFKTDFKFAAVAAHWGIGMEGQVVKVEGEP